MIVQPDEDRDLAFIASEDDPQTRHELARDIVASCRRITLNLLAQASREKRAVTIEALKAQQKGFDEDFRLISKNDPIAIERALTTHAKFLREQNKAMRSGQKPSHLSNGPR